MDKKQSPQKRFIRLPEVLSRTGYGRTSIYRKMEDGDFPKSVKLGGPPNFRDLGNVPSSILR